ncbi:MAG: ABC transporter ATP-binding protein [Candidatus Methylomirabilales bacterium]
MAALLEAGDLRKDFGRLAAVAGVSLGLAEGTLTAIIGPNGAGKTTLINLLTGLLLPDAGTIHFKGRDITRMPPYGRVRLGLARSFQIMTIFPNLTVHQNLLLPTLSRRGLNARAMARLGGATEANEEADELLREIGLWEQRDVKAGVLSHGDQRLLEMGIAVATHPELCFLDEPCAGMNPVERQAVLGLMRKLAGQRRTTFVVVEHDMDVVFALAQRIVVMNHGQILADGAPGSIRENREVREIYLGTEV